jgi:multidrug efflux pump subunit AcrA (membrane-fusion protein)
MRYLFLAGFVLLFPLSFVVRAADTVVLPGCEISPVDEVAVPAQEPGLLMKIPVREGQQVTKGELLAQIDDIVPRAKQNVASYKLDVAQREAKDDINIRFSKAAAAVARADCEQDDDANRRIPGTVQQATVREHLLKTRQMELSIEKAVKDMDVAKLQAGVSQAELDAAAAEVARCRIVAPLDAMVMELKPHAGEWVQAGDTITRLLRLDLLRVEGTLDAKSYRPSEIQDQPVQVVVTLPHGQKESFSGKIVFVRPVVEGRKFLSVRAEVQNRRQNGFWILSPGQTAEMTIQLK